MLSIQAVTLLFAQVAAAPAGWGLKEFLIAVVVIAGAVAVVAICCRVFGLQIPQWFWQIGGIILLVLFAVFAIRLIFAA